MRNVRTAKRRIDGLTHSLAAAHSCIASLSEEVATMKNHVERIKEKLTELEDRVGRGDSESFDTLSERVAKLESRSDSMSSRLRGRGMPV